MIGISESDLAPIRRMAIRLEPATDRTRMGSWGILFLTCGSIVGQSLSWKATIIEHLPSRPVDLLNEWLAGPNAEIEIAFVFRDYVQKWATDRAALSQATARLHALEENQTPFNEKARDAILGYLLLAIMLNSLSSFAEGGMGAIQSWTGHSSARWETLFFAAGLLLSGAETFRWDKLSTALLAMSGPLKPELRALLDSCSEQARR